jgi:glucosamine-6-phosphate deaminase
MHTLPTGNSVVVVDNYEELSRRAAEIVLDTIAGHPGAAITLPTGDTPRGMYEYLVGKVREGGASFEGIEFFCLDDYLGKGIDDETSLTAWLNEIFLVPAAVQRPNIHFVPTLADDPDEAAAAYDAEIRGMGGLELAVLGLGRNGHIGFNEPGSAIDSRTRVVDLTHESQAQNAAYYDSAEGIPKQAMTIGIGTLLEAKQIVLIASGAAKADILRDSLRGEITPDVPGSFLQTAGDRLTVIVDQEAASALKLG